MNDQDYLQLFDYVNQRFRSAGTFDFDYLVAELLSDESLSSKERLVSLLLEVRSDFRLRSVEGVRRTVERLALVSGGQLAGVTVVLNAPDRGVLDDETFENRTEISNLQAIDLAGDPRFDALVTQIDALLLAMQVDEDGDSA